MAANDPILSVIIVSFNTKDLTLQTLHSTVRDILNSPELTEKSEIIVVDNNSQDDSVSAIKTFASSSEVLVKLIQNNDNRGFAAANNQGISKAAGECLLLLNSDTLVQAGALQKLVMSFSETPESASTAVLSSEANTLDNLGVLSASLINWDGTYQPQGGNTPTLLSVAVQMFFLDDLPVLGRLLPSTQHTGKNTRPKNFNSDDQNQNFIQKDWVAGTAMMIKRAVINEVGDLDENIFMYGEDVEFCLRAKQHHWDIAEHPTARITHFGTASSTSKKAIIGEFNGYYYIWSKHKPFWQLPILKLLLQVGALLRILIFGTIAKDQDKVTTYQEALGSIPKK